MIPFEARRELKERSGAVSERIALIVFEYCVSTRLRKEGKICKTYTDVTLAQLSTRIRKISKPPSPLH